MDTFFGQEGGQLEMLCLGWVQTIVWHCPQKVRGEGRGAAVLGRHMLLAGKWHPRSGWGLFPGLR